MLIAWNVILAALCAGLVLATGLLALQNRSQYPAAARLLGLAAACLAALGTISVLIVPPSLATAELAPPTLHQSATPSLPGGTAVVETPALQLPNKQPAILPSAQAGVRAASALGAERLNNLDPTETSQPQPARLRIARLNVDAIVLTIPIVNGQWDLSTLGREVGWLTTTGAFPGDTLAMALVGHITTETYARGAFADLEQIKPGDEIVYTALGIEYVYQVRRRSRVTPENVKALYVSDGQTLLLLTCTDWDADGKRYANRLLVEAGLVTQRAASGHGH